MSEAGDDESDKPYEASRRKLEDARKKGEIVRSQDAVNLVVLATFVVGLSLVFDELMTDIVLDMQSFLARSVERRAGLDATDSFGRVTGWITPLFATLLLLPCATVIAGLIAARQVIFTPDKLKPKLNRISVIANAKKKYGWAGLFDFAKNFAKFLVFACILWVFVSDGYRLFQTAILRGEHMAIANIYEVARRWFWISLVAYGLFAAIDVVWQMHSHARKNRMSHKEMKDEHKNEEGDENIRQQRRAKAEEIAKNRMLLDVPKAAVVITNPTHYAVALEWSGAHDAVPKCVARGTDETARRIREIAVQSGVPLYRDPPTARELYATVKVGMTIERDHYKAVAAAIGYARKIQGMMRS